MLLAGVLGGHFQVMLMNIADVLSPAKIRLRVAVPTKPALLDYLINIVHEQGELLDVETARQAVFEREKRLSTGIGYGIALPHAKTNAVRTTTAAVVTLAEPVDFESLDGIPVDIAMLILGRENDVRTHLQLLGKVSRIISTDELRETFRRKLLGATTPEEVYQYLSTAD